MQGNRRQGILVGGIIERMPVIVECEQFCITLWRMGAFGGSPLASKSYFGSPPCQKHVAGDVNGDCVVNFKDLGFVARDWLKNNSP